MRSMKPCTKRVSDDAYLRTVALMGTFVTMQVIGHGADPQQTNHRDETVERAFGWFRRVEECCTRFEPQSEVMQLTARVGISVPVSAILYEAVRFALAVAEESDGAFDPTVGYAMESRGFNREYRTGKSVRTTLEPAGSVSYRDVRLDPGRKTITLLRPLILDLGAVAKGMAIDLAARELLPFENFAIDAGGDLYLAGCNPDGEPWSVGIRNPRRENELIDTLRVSNRAVCTSGDYESQVRRREEGVVITFSIRVLEYRRVPLPASLLSHPPRCWPMRSQRRHSFWPPLMVFGCSIVWAWTG